MAVLGHLRLVRLSECVFPRRQGRNELRSQTLLAAHALRSLAHTPLVTARLAFLLVSAVKRLDARCVSLAHLDPSIATRPLNLDPMNKK